tara:strand:+ start:167 stop:1015 length:849 start_codon:yes stop_codon:yes gene_type:complete
MIPKNGLSIISWNVNGIRSKIVNEKTSAKKCPIPIEEDSNMAKMINNYDPDIICLSEVRCAEDVSKRIVCDHYPYKYYHQSTRTERGRGAGYSGTAIWSKIQPINVYNDLPTLKESNCEGRILVAEYKDFYLINVYTPNSGSNEEYRINEWDMAMLKYINTLKKTKGVVLVGDMNVCHTELDYHDTIPTKRRIAGLLPEERENFSNYIDNGMVDTFRYKYNDVCDGFTWWTPLFKQARILNKGWRLDYALVTDSLINYVNDSIILKDVMGSDHCPILLELEL